MVADSLELLVNSGPDLGARLRLTATAKLVGRGRDCALQLSDRSISRRHFLIERRGAKVFVRIEAGASPLLVDGQQYAEISLDIGQRFIVGETALTAIIVSDTPSPSNEREVTQVRSLMSDRSVGARGLAAVFDLSESLDEAADADAVLFAVRRWATKFAVADSVTWYEADDAVSDEIVEQPSADGRHCKFWVPLVGTPGRALELHISGSEGERGSTLRRLLATAGRLVASALARLAALHEAETKSVAFRRLAWGSARSFLGESESAQRVQQLIDKLAQRDVTVLIGGETGVGKSFLARLLHEASERKREPFRVVNCAAIPENLVESELFGHERGAFTGALERRQGVLEAVGAGTVLLDEIGDLPLPSQAKLLHVLESRSFEPVGSHRTVSLQARVLAATNRDLQAMTETGQFRSDLYFRLSVVGMKVPPLRSRGKDIVLLAERFLVDLSQAAGRRVRGFHDDAKQVMLNYAWPGNVRELRNAVEHALVLGEEEWVRAGDLPMKTHLHEDSSGELEDGTVKLPLPLAELEAKAIEAALHHTQGNRTKAAAILGINRVTLYKKLKAAKADIHD